MAKAWLFFMTQKGMVKQPLAATPKKRCRKLRGTKEICSYQHLSRRFLIGFWCCVRRGGQVSYCSHLGWSHLLVPRQCVATSSATMAQFSKPLSGTLLTYTTFVESPPSMHWRTVLHMTDEQKKIFVWKIIRVVRTCWHWKHKRTLQTNFQIGNSEGCESLANPFFCIGFLFPRVSNLNLFNKPMKMGRWNIHHQCRKLCCLQRHLKIWKTQESFSWLKPNVFSFWILWLINELGIYQAWMKPLSKVGPFPTWYWVEGWYWIINHHLFPLVSLFCATSDQTY